MTKDELYAWGERNGWERNTWGHLHKGNLRIKVQTHTIRIESRRVIEKTQYSPRKVIWVKKRLGRLSKMGLDENDKFTGLTN